MAQGCPGYDSLCLASYIHGLTSEVLSASISPRSIIPGDLARGIGGAIRMIEAGKHDNLLSGNPYWTRREQL